MIYSKLLSNYGEVLHGFTTREEGDRRNLRASQNCAIGPDCEIKGKEIVLAEQVHQDKIAVVEKKHKGQTIKGVDGLLTSKLGIFLGIHTADCLPILFYEPKAKIVGAVHAGWQGTLMSISQEMVKEIESLGGKAKNIVATIGPHIGMCCYDVSKERARLFEEKFGKDSRVISFFGDKPHLDLAYVNFLELLQSGVKKENLEVPLSCTSCHKDLFSKKKTSRASLFSKKKTSRASLFFSFRRSKKENDKYGEMLAFIGLRSNETGGHEFSHPALSWIGYCLLH